jgi:hypothetical protein
MLVRNLPMSDYSFKVFYRVSSGAILYLLAAWFFGRLSWPLAGQTFVFSLLLPVGILWSWPEERDSPIWSRTLASAVLIAVIGLAVLALMV